MRQYWNNDWYFAEEVSDALLEKEYPCELEKVRLPHTVKEVPYHYFDESEYQKLSVYRKTFFAPVEWREKTLLLTFEGIAHDSAVFLNGKQIGEHHCGYTAFTLDISEAVVFGEENTIAVRVDSRESLNIPPFGFVIDYMTFGGIYRDVYLDIRNPSYIEDVFIKPKFWQNGKSSLTVSEIRIKKAANGMKIRQSIRRAGSGDAFTVLKTVLPIDTKSDVVSVEKTTGEIELWSMDKPVLYEMKTELLTSGTEVLDEYIVRFGFRKAVFKKDGFYLNDKKVKLRGLNRHQSYPYAGYAMPESMQKLDADILKKELGVNAVRTSHYPQAQHFIDRCDELGLMVFTEIPGWQHIGNEQWKQQAVENVKDMVLQYRNHPSIILWGVRINESVDDDEFYSRTNEVCRSLDPTRQTGGVRCYKKGSFLEDVYTYNDFVHEGTNRGCENKNDVTSDAEKPYLISEYNGHMFPCKTFDWEEKRCEHAIRHAKVLDDVAAHDDIAGSFGWCMFDYNTHKDFGSGDRICYHGVMDMFRNPKLAAAVYASQQEEIPVLEVSSSFDIGEHPGCNRGDVYIFSNADSVKMYKNDVLLKEYDMRSGKFGHLIRGPVRVDDYVGDALEKGEGMAKKQADAVKSLLNEVASTGLYRLPKTKMAKALVISARYKMKISDAVELFNKYVGNWGGESTVYRFEAVKDRKTIAEKTFKPMTKCGLIAEADHTDLKEGNSYDVALVRIRAVDENGNTLHFSNDPVALKTEGPVELIGPEVISLPGGLGGTYVKTIGESGEAKLIMRTAGGIEKEIKFSVTVSKES